MKRRRFNHYGAKHARTLTPLNRGAAYNPTEKTLFAGWEMRPEGGNIIDVVSTFDGTIDGSVEKVIRGLYGPALRFAADSFLNTGISVGDLDARIENHSFSIWVFMTSTPSPYCALFGRGVGATGYTYANGGVWINSSRQLRYYHNDGASYKGISGATPLDLYRWQNIVYSVNHADQTVTLYLDGAIEGTPLNTSSMLQHASIDADSFLVGANSSVSSGVGEFDQGYIAKPQLFASALDASDVSDLIASDPMNESLIRSVFDLGASRSNVESPMFEVNDLAAYSDCEIFPVNADGVIGFGRNQPRVGAGAKGLCVHEVRSYLLAPTYGIGGGDWATTELTPTDDAGAAPDGSSRATKLTFSSNGMVEHKIERDIVVENSTRYTISLFAKMDDAESWDVGRFNLGFLGMAPQFKMKSVFTEESIYEGPDGVGLADGWRRHSFSFTTGASDAGTQTIGVQFGKWESHAYNWDAAGDGSEHVFVWGLQIEKAEDAGPYVEIADLGGGVSVEAPIYEFRDVTYTDEMFPDGDAELSTVVGWFAINVTMSKESGARTGGDGQRVLRLTSDGITTNEYATKTGWGLTVGNTYRLRGWMRADGVSESKPSVSSNAVYVVVGAATNDWQYFDVIVVAAAANITLHRRLGASGWVEFDDITIERVGSSTVNPIIQRLNQGRIALRCDFTLPSTPNPSDEGQEDFSIFSLWEDVDNYLDCTLSAVGGGMGTGDRWRVNITDGTSSESATQAGGGSDNIAGETELAIMLKLYSDGTGTLWLIDTEDDSVILEHEFSGFTWPDLTVDHVRLGCDHDGLGQRHMYINELRTW